MVWFACTVFLSAFLLFQVQPIAAKMILPWFGGTSSVWSVCLVFFQATLLLGYAYVHWLHERLPPRRQMAVHGTVLLLSLLALPITADPAWKGLALEHPSLSVLGVLAVTVGVPYLLLSTTGPLMQAWYARAHAGTAQPYRLYALSNLGSMLALLSYPVLVEPWLTVPWQGLVWSAGYAAFVMVCLGTLRHTWRRGHDAPPASHTPSPAAPAVPGGQATAEASPPWHERLLWVALAATPSLLLLAITRHLTQDVAPVPFLWVLPLSLYLLSFILCFDAPRYYVRPLFIGALPLAFWALDHVLNQGANVPLLVSLLNGALFVFCMVCHGELVRRRPPVRHLTLFYLMLSVGGALGGLLVGLVAPAIFDAYHELPLGLMLCALLVVIVLWPQAPRLLRTGLVLALLAYGLRLGQVALDTVEGYRSVTRNFYGQLRVEDSRDERLGPMRALLHGRINHGEQALAPEHQREPTAYYCRDSGIGRAIASLPQDRPRHIGIVGLGTGTLATYGRAGDTLRLYEINEQVLALARRDFTYLADTPATTVPVLGDGRLMLEREPAQRFDLLAMDAFSGDSIPTHLLTLEALRSYRRHLRHDGLLALHITNRYLDLEPVMAAAARTLGLKALALRLKPASDDLFCRSSTWVLLLTPEQAEQLPAPLRGGEWVEARPGFQPWTDHFSNLLAVLK